MFVLIKVVRFINNMHYFDKGGVIYKLYTLLTKSSEQIKYKMHKTTRGRRRWWVAYGDQKTNYS